MFVEGIRSVQWSMYKLTVESVSLSFNGELDFLPVWSDRGVSHNTSASETLVLD